MGYEFPKFIQNRYFHKNNSSFLENFKRYQEIFKIKIGNLLQNFFIDIFI